MSVNLPSGINNNPLVGPAAAVDKLKDWGVAAMSGAGLGLLDLLHTALHPLDDLVYPLTELASDALILTLPEGVVDNPLLIQEASQRMELREQALQGIGEAFAKGDGPLRIEMGTRIGTTIFAPGFLLKGIKMSQNFAKFAVFENPPKFHNTEGEFYHLTVGREPLSAIRETTKSKHFMYVITEEGKLIIGPEGPQIHKPFSEPFSLSHYDLGGLKPVVTAGNFRAKEGKIYKINNFSGHYVPKSPDLHTITEHVFAKHGFPEVKNLFKYHKYNTKKGVETLAVLKKIFGDDFKLTPKNWDKARIMTHQKIPLLNPLGLSFGAYTALHANAAEASVLPPFSENVTLTREMSYAQAAAWQQEGEKIAIQTLETVTASFLENVNLIFSDQAFAQKAYEEMLAGQNTLGVSGLPLLRNAALVFKVIDPERAFIVAETAANTKLIVDGTIEVINILRDEGVIAMATSTAMSFSTGNVVKGVTNLLNLYSMIQERKSSGKAMQALFGAVRTVSRQLASLDEGFRGYFKETSRMLMVISSQNAEGFKYLFRSLNLHHEEEMRLLNDLKAFLYIDQIYLEQMNAALEEMQRSNYMQLIDRAEWSKAVGSAEILCKVHQKSLKLEQMETAILELRQVLSEVQLNSAARAKIPMSDQKGLVERLTALSGFQRNGEQNIHLFAAYLKYRLPGLELPEQLNNPAAVTDVIDAVIRLIKTYQNRETGYLGLPRELGESLDDLLSSITSLEQFMRALPPTIATLWEDYEQALMLFGDRFDQSLAALMHQYNKKQGRKREERKIEKPVIAISLDHPNWFKPAYRCIENFVPHFTPCPNPDYFKIRWRGPVHPHLHQCSTDRFSWIGEMSADKHPVPANFKERCHFTTTPPVHLINVSKAKADYQQLFDQRVAAIFTQNETAVEPVDLFSLRSVDVERRFYFENSEGFPLPLTTHHLQQIPKELRLGEELGLGKFRFTWKFNEAKDRIVLKAHWDFALQGDNLEILLYEQESAKLTARDFATPLQALLYTWFGGEAPQGWCAAWDYHLGRFSDMNDQEALNFYSANPTVNSVTQTVNDPLGKEKARDYYHPTVCVPQTAQVQGVSDLSVFNSWTLKKGSEEALQLALHTQAAEVRRIRRELMHEAASRIAHPSKDGSEWELLSQNYHDLNLKNAVLKIALSFALNPAEVDLDTTWPGLLSGADILHKIKTYRGQPYHPGHTLRQAIYWQKRLKEPVIEQLETRTAAQYPFVDRKETLEEFREEIEPELVSRWVAETECTFLECEELWESNGFQREFTTLPPFIQERFINKHPYLALGDGSSSSSSWPLPGAQAVSYQGTFNEQFYLVQYILHYFKKWFAWGSGRELKKSKVVKLNTEMVWVKTVRGESGQQLLPHRK